MLERMPGAGPGLPGSRGLMPSQAGIGGRTTGGRSPAPPPNSRLNPTRVLRRSQRSWTPTGSQRRWPWTPWAACCCCWPQCSWHRLRPSRTPPLPARPSLLSLTGPALRSL
ncbi:small integral membrane protein 24 isoform X2 [Psammomys obesus]|uniref:small integral membrane protein 24 isoform X2 n=1 Tax=Psammomys obesus TaxID=48139 RepID=UPI002452E4B4|nr:small integral membrane protein 24 isoform X2 [Psammomys obesus]